jgi:hypothetical protein
MDMTLPKYSGKGRGLSRHSESKGSTLGRDGGIYFFIATHLTGHTALVAWALMRTRSLTPPPARSHVVGMFAWKN